MEKNMNKELRAIKREIRTLKEEVADLKGDAEKGTEDIDDLGKIATRTIIEYIPLPTMKAFHESGAPYRCLVGEVASGKKTACLLEIGYYLPMHIAKTCGIKETRWLIFSDSWYHDLRPVINEWFPWGEEDHKHQTFKIKYPDGIVVNFFHRDNKAKKAELMHVRTTGAWVLDSEEITEETKHILKNRVGRYPLQRTHEVDLRYYIESSHPLKMNSPKVYKYKWMRAPFQTTPLNDHEGFWQPPMENGANLPPGYYDHMKGY